MSHACPADRSPWPCARMSSREAGVRRKESASTCLPSWRTALWRTASTAAKRLAAREKSLFMGPRLRRVFPALAIKACYHRFAILFRPHIRRGTILYTPQAIPLCAAPRSKPATPERHPRRLTRHSAKCYKSTFCVRPFSGPTGAVRQDARRQIDWVRMQAASVRPGSTKAKSFIPVPS